MQNYLKNMPESTKKVLGVVGPLVVLVILFVIVAKFGISNVIELRSKINSAQKEETVLSQKVKVLETVSDALVTGSKLSTAVMPESNPSLIVLSQLKILAGTKGVFINNVKAGAEVKDETGLSRVDLSFNSRGTREAVLSFLSETGNLAPIVKLNKLKITQSSGETLATISVASFWSPFPKTLPDVTEGINDLTPAEQTTLSEISNLIQPIFTDIPAIDGGKDDPFGI